MPSSDQKSVVTVRISGAMKASLQQSADEKGGNLSAEMLHRLTEYEAQRSLIDGLISDSSGIKVAVGLETLRKGAKVSPANSISNNDTASLERAVVTAACISQLFKTVAEHAGKALAEKREISLADIWARRIEAGELRHDFDIQAMATEISSGLSDIAMGWGEDMAEHVGTTIGPNIWDTCFEKNDPLRSTAPGMGYGLMGTLHGSSVGLPPSFIPPLQTEDDWIASVKKKKDSGMLRDAAKGRISDGQYPGKSEDEVVDMLYDELMTFDTDPNEAGANVTAG